MQDHTFTLKTVPTPPHDIANLLIKGIRERHVQDEPALEESKRPNTLGPVNDLVRHHEVARLDLLGQTSRGAEGDDAPDTEFAEGRDVGARGDFGRIVLVVHAVPRQKGDRGFMSGGWRWVFEDGDG